MVTFIDAFLRASDVSNTDGATSRWSKFWQDTGATWRAARELQARTRDTDMSAEELKLIADDVFRRAGVLSKKK